MVKLCKQGHKIAGDNKIWRSDGKGHRYEVCRICRNESSALAMQKLRDRRAARGLNQKGRAAGDPKKSIPSTQASLESWVQSETKLRVAQLVVLIWEGQVGVVG